MAVTSLTVTGSAGFLERYHIPFALGALVAGRMLAGVAAVWRPLRSWLLGAGLVVAVWVAASGRFPVPPLVWATTLVVAAVVMVVAPAAPDRPETGPTPRLVESAVALDLLGLIGLAGVWAAVPDTEPALACGGVFAAIAMGRAFWRVRPTWTDRMCWIAAILVTALWGSAGWPQWVGGVGCIGLLASPGRVTPTRPPLQLGLVIISSRWVTRFPVRTALPLAVGLVVTGIITSHVIDRTTDFGTWSRADS